MSGSDVEPAPEVEPARLLRRCRDNVALMAQMRRLYAEADAAIAAFGATCLGGGACCKFDLFDHRLYVTMPELAYLTLEPPPQPGRVRRRRCPYQVGPRCTGHARRPLGCRTFFCRTPRRAQLEEVHERFARRIRRLHDEHALPYVYADMIDLLLKCPTGGG